MSFLIRICDAQVVFYLGFAYTLGQLVTQRLEIYAFTRIRAGDTLTMRACALPKAGILVGPNGLKLLHF